MAEYTRNSILPGETIRLRALFKDRAGNFLTPTGSPSVYIYDDSVDSDVVAEEVEDETYASALAGPLVATQAAPGFWYVDYEVPEGSDTGTWSDVWVATIEGSTYQEILSFYVEYEIDITSQPVDVNSMLVIELKDSIASTSAVTLDETQLFFTVTYDPYYSSPDQVRSQAGPWINYLTDAAIALLIHWSSKEADFLKNKTPKNWSDYKFARSMFVTFDTILKIVNQPGGGLEAGFASGRKKELGDLKITDGTPNVQIPDNLYAYFIQNRNDWARVVNAGGTIVPGQSFDLSSGVRGDCHNDSFKVGRQWLDPNEYYYEKGGANTKVRGNGRLYRFWYRGR